MKKRLIILSGPSCVGKSPLIKALKRVHPEISFQMPILHTSRPPRSIETEGVDYYFRSEQDIRSFPRERFIVGQIRKIWQAIDLMEMQVLFTHSSLIILEIYPTLGKLFRDHPLIRKLIDIFFKIPLPHGCLIFSVGSFPLTNCICLEYTYSNLWIPLK